MYGAHALSVGRHCYRHFGCVRFGKPVVEDVRCVCRRWLASGRNPQAARGGRRGAEKPVANERNLGNPELDRPILADFLAMGGGSALPTALPERAESFETPAAAVLPARVLRRGSTDRRLVVVALQRSRALHQPIAETPLRSPMDRDPTVRSAEPIPALFAESYADYTKRAAGNARVDESDVEPNLEEHADGSYPMRLRLLPWHRHSLQVMLCRSVLFEFTQTLREVLKLRSNQKPLLAWEAKQAQEFSAEGEVISLVKYLVETELHMQTGPERKIVGPGSVVATTVGQRVREERRRLGGQWSVTRMNLEEDAVIRIYLDGRMTWPRIRDLLTAAPLQQGSR